MVHDQTRLCNYLSSLMNGNDENDGSHFAAMNDIRSTAVYEGPMFWASKVNTITNTLDLRLSKPFC